jgi:ABC-type tungstate transport system substrate-binding protein
LLQTGLGDFGFSIALGIILLGIALVIVIVMNLITSGAMGDFDRIMGGSPRA